MTRMSVGCCIHLSTVYGVLAVNGNINPLHPIAAKCAREISCPLHPIAAKCARTSLPLFIVIAAPFWTWS